MKAIAILLSIGLLVLAPALPAQAAGCVIQEASQAALERQIRLIEETKVDASDFFSGSNSCINSNLLNNFSFAILIPDLAGFVQGAIINAAKNFINDAKEQVCEAVNDQIQNAIGKVNSTIGNFENSLSSELKGILNNGRQNIQLPIP